MRLNKISLQNTSDNEILALFKRTGNKALLGALFRKHLHRITGLCFYYLKDETLSEDATMDIFEHVVHKVDQYDIQNFESWLYQVTRNHCLKLLKGRFWEGNAPISEINEEIFVESGPDSDPIDRETKLEALSVALQELKGPQRQCIVLFYLKGLSYKQIELETSFTVKEIKSHIQNGKRNLKNVLAERLRSQY